MSATESRLSRRLKILVRVAAISTGLALTRFLLAVNVPVAPSVVVGLGVLALAWIVYKVGVSDLPGGYRPPAVGQPLRIEDILRSAVCFAFGFSWLMFLAPLARDTQDNVLVVLVAGPPIVLLVTGVAIIIWRQFFSILTD